VQILGDFTGRRKGRKAREIWVRSEWRVGLALSVGDLLHGDLQNAAFSEPKNFIPPFRLPVQFLETN
jgi:hypothetical protein